MVPTLDTRGFLPDGVHPSEESELTSRFGTNARREAILAGFFKLRQEAVEHGLAGLQWVNGSFVTAKETPQDLDVVTFCDYELLNRQRDVIENFYARVLSAGTKSVPTYGCDTYAVPACEPGHRYFPVFEKWRAYWRKHFAKVYDASSGNVVTENKGFISLPFGDPSLIRNVSTSR